MKRRHILIGITFAAAFAATNPAFAQDWAPGGRVTLQVGFAPGGSADTIGRLLAESVSESTGWDVIVDNRPGGGGAVMSAGLRGAPADGQHLGVAVSSALAAALAAEGGAPFAVEDFDWLGTVAVAPGAFLAKPDAEFNDMPGLIEYAKENGGALVGVPDKGTELMVRAIARDSGAELTPVPAKGGSEVMAQIMGGHVDAGFDGGRHVDYITSDDLKMIAAATNERHSYAPDISTVIEQGYDYSMEPWFVVMAPEGLPEEAITAWQDAIDAAVQDPKLIEAVQGVFGVDPVNLGSETQARVIQSVETMTRISQPE